MNTFHVFIHFKKYILYQTIWRHWKIIWDIYESTIEPLWINDRTTSKCIWVCSPSGDSNLTDALQTRLKFLRDAVGCKKMGGDLEVDSVVDRGLNFYYEKQFKLHPTLSGCHPKGQVWSCLNCHFGPLGCGLSNSGTYPPPGPIHPGGQSTSYHIQPF